MMGVFEVRTRIRRTKQKIGIMAIIVIFLVVTTFISLYPLFGLTTIFGVNNALKENSLEKLMIAKNKCCINPQRKGNELQNIFTTFSDVSSTTHEGLYFERSILKGHNVNLSKAVHRMNVFIQSNMKDIRINSELTYQNIGDKPIFFIIFETDSAVSTVLVFDAIGDLSFDWQSLPHSSIINVTLRDPLVPGSQPYTFTLSYVVRNIVEYVIEPMESYVLLLVIEHGESTKNFYLIVTLPIKYVLCNETANPPLEPEADSIFSDGQRIKFLWQYPNIVEGQLQTWIIRFQALQVPTSVTIINVKYLWGVMIGLFFGGGIIGGLAVFLVFKTITDTERKEIVETLLSKPEKDILRIIKRAGGVMTQSKICSESGFSKAKVSYYLSELEKKEIIERERWGRMNRVRIIDDVFDKVDFEEPSEDNLED